MKVLVTGTKGFSGGFVADFLKRQGVHVVSHSRQTMGDLRDLFTLPYGVRAIVHCAASSALDGKSDEDLFLDNEVATRHLADLAVHCGVDRFIYFSSVSIYGDIHAKTINEDTPIHDPKPYGASKLGGEKALDDFSSRLPSISLRLPAILGAGAHRHWLAGIVQNLQRGDSVTIFNGDRPFNNAAHIQDIARLVQDLLVMGVKGHTPLILGAKDTMSVYEVVSTLKEHFQSPSEIRVEENGKTSFHIDSSRAIKEFGYAPMTMAQMLQRYACDVKR